MTRRYRKENGENGRLVGGLPQALFRKAHANEINNKELVLDQCLKRVSLSLDIDSEMIFEMKTMNLEQDPSGHFMEADPYIQPQETFAS